MTCFSISILFRKESVLTIFSGYAFSKLLFPRSALNKNSFIIIIIINSYGLGLVACSNSELLLKLRVTFRHLAGLLERVISPSQGLCLHSTAQHRKMRTNIHAFNGIRTHDSSIQTAETHALDRAATKICIRISYEVKKNMPKRKSIITKTLK
jgi:hypothetical protein